MKISLVHKVDDITQITTTFKIQDFSIVVKPKGRKIYFFKGQVLHIFDIALGTFVENITTLNILPGERSHFFAFKECIYAVTHDKTHLRMYNLDMVSSWKLCLEQEMKMTVIRLKSCSSSEDCAIIIESFDDSFDHIYKFTLDPVELRHYKTIKKSSEYLFVPEHICL